MGGREGKREGGREGRLISRLFLVNPPQWEKPRNKAKERRKREGEKGTRKIGARSWLLGLSQPPTQ